MKYSGVEWIGEIPDKWKLNKIGQLFDLRNEKVSDKDYSPLSVSKSGIVPQLENVAKSDASDDRKLVLKGDFAINSRSDRKMSCGVSPLDGSVSLINTILYPKNDDFIYNDYMNYLLKNYGFAEEFYRWGHGIVADLWTTKWQEMKSIMLPLPSVQEQKATYDFLNQKTKEINSLIKIENQQIEKLKEYKHAVITEAVTKGLDKNAQMKDSGVEWIGIINKESSLVRLRFLVDVETGNQDTQNAVKDGKYPFYVRSPKIERSNEYSFDGPGILMAGDGAGAGRVFHYAEGKYAVHQRVYRFSNFRLIKPRLLKYYLETMFPKVMEYGSAQTTVPSVRLPMILDFQVVIPYSQDRVLEFLDKRIIEIDSLITLKQKKIVQLEDYKKSLIYEYVTGKKEVC